MKKYLLTLIGVFFVTLMFSQREVTGTITDAEGLPLIGANVILENTTTGTITDIDGSFSLMVPDDATTLVISYTGFQDQRVDITALSEVSVALSEGELLDEVVVTALGVSRDEKALGYAVQEVSSQTIQNANTVSAIDALAGSAAGIQVTSSSGAAGASSRIVLRGQTSFNGDNEALIVVDGIRLNNDEFHSERSLGGVANSNRAMDLNPADIENVSVLKGAAATALYGIEGARGVILITTKKGQKGQPMKISYGANLTMSQVSNVVGLNDEYVQGWSGQWAGPCTAFIPCAVSWGPHKDDLYWDGSDYKWDKNGQVTTVADGNTPFVPYDNIDNFFKTGYTLNQNLSLTGGAANTAYRVSFGYSDQEGVAPLNTFSRYNLGGNVSTSAMDDKLNISFSANYVKSGGRRLQQGSNISGVMLGLLRTPISFDNSNGVEDPVNDVSSYTFEDNSQRNFRGGGGYDNPFWVANNTPFFDDVNRLFGNFVASYEVSPWVTVQANIGTDVYTDNRIQRFEIGSRNAPAGQVIEDNYNYRHTDMYFNLLGSGNLTDDLTFSYNTGINLYDEKLKNTYVQGDGLSFYGFPELGNTGTIASQIDNTNERTAGVFASVDFGFQNFLYLTLTGRNDWSSTLINPLGEFSSGDISFFYPSASLGLIFTEKLDISFLSFGKLRASYAEVGGGAPTPYSTSTTFLQPLVNAGTINDVNDGWTNGVGFPFQGTAGFLINGVAGNPFLTPSKTSDIEVGFDLRFFNDRIGLDATYYTRESVDQIIAINIPNSTGFQRAFVNSGELATVGGEIVLTANPVRTSDFNWNFAVNFAKWKTTVESLPENVQNQYLDGFTGTQVNNIAPEVDENGNITRIYEYGQIYGGAFQHVNTDNGTFDPSAEYNPDGALVIEDDPTSGNYGFPRVDPNPTRVIGNPNPDFTVGITNTFSYKALSLSFLFDIRQGGDIWNGTKGAITFFGTSELSENRGTVTVFDGVLPDGSPNDISVVLDQNWYTGNGGGFGAVAEHFVEDGSFKRLRYVTLSYDLGSVLGDAGFDNLSLSFTGRNLFLSTPYTGFDPELSLVGSSSNGQGLDYFQMPNVKSYAIGLNATF